MKITEVIKKCQAGAENLRIMAEENSNGSFLRGRAWGCDECASVLEETVREIRKEIDSLNIDITSRYFPEELQAEARGRIISLKWVLGEEDQK